VGSPKPIGGNSHPSSQIAPCGPAA